MESATKNYCLRFAHLAVASWLVAVLGCNDLPGKPNPANKPIMPDQVLDFDKLFANNCAGCHGSGGKLGPAPPLNDPLFVEIISSEQILNVVKNGRPGTPMPPFSRDKGGPLTNEQIDVLAQGIRTHWKPDQPSDNPLPAYALTENAGAVAGNRQRGAEVFSRACAGCHGQNGLGKVRDGTATNVINTSAFLSLISDQALRRIIITGRPDLGMPSYNEHTGRPADFQPLTSEDINDLVALLADWRATNGTVVNSTP